MYIVEVEVV